MNTETIAEIAYRLWEQNCRPEGRSEEFWLRAEKAYYRLLRCWYEGEYELINEEEAQKLIREHQCYLTN